MSADLALDGSPPDEHEWGGLGTLDYAVAAGDLDMLGVVGPPDEEMTAERRAADAAALQRARAMAHPELAGPVAEPLPGTETITAERIVLAAADYPEPVDCGTLTLSEWGGVEYVADLIIPGRIHIVAAEEGTGAVRGALSTLWGPSGGARAGASAGPRLRAPVLAPRRHLCPLWPRSAPLTRRARVPCLLARHGGYLVGGFEPRYVRLAH